MTRWGAGPVFAADCMTTSRRWQIYAGRALLVACVLLGLILVWLERFRGQQFTSHQQLAEVGLAFFHAIMGVELVLVLMLVPAATAGAICQDKMRGGLTLMMVTDLSDAEIVLGRFASRLANVLGVIVCGLPVLAIASSLGGVESGEVVGGSMVIVGVAVLGVGVSMTFSVWATKPHESLMATYATWAVWLLAALAWSETVRGWRTPDVLLFTNPFWLIFEVRGPASGSFLARGVLFLVGCVTISIVLAVVSTRRIRAVTLRQASRVQRPTASRWGWLRMLRTSRISLDRDPVLWRECHRRRTSGWGRAIWWLYAVLSTSFTLLAIFVNNDIATGVSAFMVSIGLLMVSVTSATALAEERSQGSLDVLMASPLQSREIVMGKWRGAFRIVPKLAILPGLLAFGTALVRGHGIVAIPFALLIAALVMAYGAVVTSLGLAFATWQSRLGRAVGFGVSAYLLLTVIYPTIVLMLFQTGPDDVLLLWVSPFFGMFLPMGRVTWRSQSIDAGHFVAMFVWILLASAVAFGLLRLTLATFDRFLGRVPALPDRFVPIPAPQSSKSRSAARLSDWA
jgi:ABC-type transport system involved in multi-copper enzyme maturation permease subunit